MENNQKIVIGKKILTKEELFKEKEKFRKERAKLLFDEKIKALVQLQQLALIWGNKKDVIIWRI